MSYHFSRTMDRPFDDAVAIVTEVLKSNGFGIVSEIDVGATLRTKLGVDFRPYRILGACNPGLAHQAILAESRIGTMLPCNVVIQQIDENKVEISGIDPIASMLAIDNPQLGEIARKVQELMKKVIDELPA
ncbi:MAG TPA: DUF302 domain-containing protein [Arenibaculum sp.]|nr:DUF302 domain-containing protein [Arenibaculum sp.]